jgi:dTMP kinase
MFKDNESPRLIYIEGFDGCGKTTVTAIFEKKLKDYGFDVTCVNILKEDPQALALRTILTNHSSVLHPQAELFMYLAAVTNTYHHCVTKALDAGKLVLCDRGPMSSLVYQANAFSSVNSSLPLIHSLAFKDFSKAHTVLVLSDEAQCDARINKRFGGADRIESRDKVYRDRVIKAYVDECAKLIDERQSVQYVYNNTTLQDLESSCNGAIEQILDYTVAT